MISTASTQSPRVSHQTTQPIQPIRGISLDNTPFDIEAFDLDELLATASAEHSSADSSDYEEFEISDFEMNDPLKSFDNFVDMPEDLSSTSFKPDDTQKNDFFLNILSMFRSNTPTNNYEINDTAPTTPPTYEKVKKKKSTSSKGNISKNTMKAKKCSSSNKNNTIVDPKRIEARIASQRYRDQKLQEYEVLKLKNQELTQTNSNLRHDLLARGINVDIQLAPLDLTTVPGCVDLSSTWKRAETRKERNRQAAKRSREAAKRKHNILKAKNHYLELDIVKLKNILQDVQNDKRICGIIEDVSSSKCETATSFVNSDDDKIDYHQQQRKNKKRFKHKKKSSPASFLLSESSMLLFACVCAILSMSFQFRDNSEVSSTTSSASMDIGSGLFKNMAPDENNPLPMVGASIVCIVSAMFFLFSKSDKKETL